MTIAPDSCGWGHGPWGFHVGGFADGPWPTFPDTPGYPHTTEVHYDVRPFVFEDGSELMVQPHRLPGQTITYVEPPNDPTWLGGIASWHIAAGGRRDRFLVMDHTARTVYASRFHSARLGRTRGAGNRLEIEPVTFRAEREIEYRDTVLGDQPIAYWPLREGLETNSPGELVGSLQLRMVSQSWILRPTAGPLLTYTGSTSAFQFLSSGFCVNNANSLQTDVGTGSMAWELWFQTATTFLANQFMYEKDNNAAAGGCNISITASGGVRVLLDAIPWTSGSRFNTGSWHHVVVRAVRSGTGAHFGDVWVDARMVGSQSLATISLDVLQSLTGPTVLGALFNSTAYFVGQMAEVAVYRPEISSAQILAHYEAGMRWRA